MPILNSTTSLDFAIFLAATYKEDHNLRLLGVHPVEPGSQQLKFVFEGGDPGKFADLERDFLEGGKAPALAMLATMRRIRKLMELAKKEAATKTKQPWPAQPASWDIEKLRQDAQYVAAELERRK